jgi:chaperone modulatory protein CbpM
MTTPPVTAVILDEDATFSLAELCTAASVTAEDLIAMVEEGILDPLGSAPPNRRFPASHLRRVLVTLRLQRDLHVNLAGVALALDLLEEVRRLRNHIRAVERDL